MNIGTLSFKIFPRLHQYLALLDMMQTPEGDGRALFMSKGLGKTKVILDWIVNAKPERVLIIIPKIATKTWNDEIRDNTDWGPNQVYHARAINLYNTYQFTNLMRYPIIIMTYERVRLMGINFFKAHNWDAVILDESTRIKNTNSQITRTILNAFTHAKRRFILSGRPRTNSLIDLFAQYWFLDNGNTFGKSESQFKNQYMFMGFNYKWMLLPSMKPYFYRAIAKKAIIYTSKFMLEYEGRAFPKSITRNLFLSLSPTQADYMSTLVDEFRLKLGDKTIYETDWRLAVDTKLRQICAGFLYLGKEQEPIRLKHPKTKLLGSILEDLEGEKVVIFTTFREEGGMIYEQLKRWYPTRPITVLRAGMSATDIEISITEHEDSEDGILLSNASLARYSLSLSSTRYAIYHSRSFSAETYDQSRGRIARLSTLYPDVYYYNLIYKDSIDTLIHDALTHNLSQGDYLNKVVSYIQERRI